jgi:hypothetical protein
MTVRAVRPVATAAGLVIAAGHIGRMTQRHEQPVADERPSENIAEYARPTIAPCETVLRAQSSRFCMALNF